MNRFPFGVASSVKIDILDINGQLVTPTGLLIHVMDQDDNEIYSDLAVTIPSTSYLDYEISDVVNDKIGTETTELRTVRLTVIYNGGTSYNYVSYVLEDSTKLIVPSNTFQSYGRALLTAETIPNIENWNTASKQEREVALQEAYYRLTKFGFKFLDSEWSDQSRINVSWGTPSTIPPAAWSEMTLEIFDDYPDRFKVALRKAQIVEADEIISGVDPNDKRRIGVLSESIGESSMMFRMGKPLELGVSHRAMEYLKGFLNIRITTTRS